MFHRRKWRRQRRCRFQSSQFSHTPVNRYLSLFDECEHGNVRASHARLVPVDDLVVIERLKRRQEISFVHIHGKFDTCYGIQLRGANEKDTVFRFNQSVQDHGRDRKQIQRDFGGNFYGNLNCLKKYNFMKLLQTTIF